MGRALVCWFTGLSGAGKSTIAAGVRNHLEAAGVKVLTLDGDDVRRELHRHLGFTEPEIKENNSLIAGLCETHRSDADVILVPIISPYAQSRAAARKRLTPGFIEVHVKADINVLEARDTKGYYAKARNGEMDNLIGYSPSAPYQAPQKPDMVLNTAAADTASCIGRLLSLIDEQHQGAVV